MKKIFSIAPIFILVAGLFAGIYYSTQKSGFELRKKASEISGSQFILKSPSSVKPGEQFSVDIILDASTDPKYTISAADAIISFSESADTPPSECKGQILSCPMFFDTPPGFCPDGTLVQDPPLSPCQCPPAPRCAKGKEISDGNRSREFMKAKLSLISVTPGKIFDSYPTLPKSEQYPRPLPPEKTGEIGFMPGPIPSTITSPASISGIKNYAATDQGLFNGFSGSGTFATLTFIAPQSGTVTVQIGYSGPDGTNDSNINGFLKDTPVSLQKPIERLLTAPQAVTIRIEKPQITISPTATPAVISCGGLIGKECPSGMECVYPIENTDKDKIVSNRPDQMGTCTVRVRPTKSITPPPPALTCTPPPPCAYKEPFCDYAQAGVVYCPISPAPTPTSSPTPKPTTGTVNARVTFEGYTHGPVEVSLFGLLDLPKPYVKTNNNNSLMLAPEQVNVPAFLGKGTTNPDGSVRITVGREFLSKPYYLFVETPLHLRKYQISDPKPVVLTPDCTGDICTTEIKNLVVFGELTPGDINADTLGKKDQIINSFDVSVLYTQWSGADAKSNNGFSEINKRPAGTGDLNRDGVVNTRDLAIILKNFNKRGETEPAVSIPLSILDRYYEKDMMSRPVSR